MTRSRRLQRRSHVGSSKTRPTSSPNADATGAAATRALTNAAGAPAISLPLGKSRTGLPIGVQFAAAPGEDALLLELALSIEQARPWNALVPRERWLQSGWAN